jgi:hypothetical protein
MSKYDPNKTWYFEIYTYFGRVLHREAIPLDETHHRALDRARKVSQDYGVTNWVRLIT